MNDKSSFLLNLEQFNFEKVNCSNLGFARKSQLRGTLRQFLLAVKRASQAQNALVPTIIDAKPSISTERNLI
jgi:hypothetical protein